MPARERASGCGEYVGHFYNLLFTSSMAPQSPPKPSDSVMPALPLRRTGKLTEATGAARGITMRGGMPRLFVVLLELLLMPPLDVHSPGH